MPANLSFAKFHAALQIAFGWADSHLHSFSVTQIAGQEDSPNHVYGRPRELLQLGPRMDDSLRAAYPEPDGVRAEEDYTLGDIFDGEEYKGKVELTYEYDMGDGWMHLIYFLGRMDPLVKRTVGVPEDVEVFCLNGEGHPCAEDCGGSGGWEDLKELFTKRKKDPEGLKEWYKHECLNGDPKGLDPYKWDIFDVNDDLTQIKA